MTPATAQALQDKAAARGTRLVWVIRIADLERPGRVVARAHTSDQYLPGALVADTLTELHAQLPAGLTRRDST